MAGESMRCGCGAEPLTVDGVAYEPPTVTDMGRLPTSTTSALEAARDDLRRRIGALNRSDSLEAWRERQLIEHLYDVADMVKRVGDHGSAHYRADKSTDMVRMAMRVRQVALERYGAAGGSGGPPLDEAGEERLEAELERTTALEIKLDACISRAMWARARGEKHYRSDVRELYDLVREFVRWADEVALDAVPDPVD